MRSKMQWGWGSTGYMSPHCKDVALTQNEVGSIGEFEQRTSNSGATLLTRPFWKQD